MQKKYEEMYKTIGDAVMKVKRGFLGVEDVELHVASL